MTILNKGSVLSESRRSSEMAPVGRSHFNLPWCNSAGGLCYFGNCQITAAMIFLRVSIGRVSQAVRSTNRGARLRMFIR